MCIITLLLLRSHVFVTLSSLRLGWGFTRCPPGVFGEDPVVLVVMVVVVVLVVVVTSSGSN